MSTEPDVTISEFVATDIDGALGLWSRTEGLGLNESETHEAFQRFLDQNLGFSAVASCADGRLVGAVLCGHDGWRGTIHHLAVASAYRRQGVAKRLLAHCLSRLRQAHIPRCNVFLYTDNDEGAQFWLKNGWQAAPVGRLCRGVSKGSR